MKSSTYILAFLFIGATIFFIVRTENKKDDVKNKNLELEKLEIEIYEKIEIGDKNGAFELLKDLAHSSTEKSTNIKEESIFGDKYYTYNEYWAEKRAELKKLISEMKHTPIKKSMESNLENNLTEEENETNDNEEISNNINETTTNEIKVDIPSELIGLYVLQYDDGSTKFYKIFKDSKGEYNVVYQDNVAGNVKVENFNITNYNDLKKEIKLNSKKNPNFSISLRFLLDKNNPNDYKVIDNIGDVYTEVNN